MSKKVNEHLANNNHKRILKIYYFITSYFSVNNLFVIVVKVFNYLKNAVLSVYNVLVTLY